VIADLVDLARELGADETCQIPSLGFAHGSVRDLPVVPMEQVVTPWYLRMEAEDKPGVMSRVAAIFSDQGISIEALIQKAPAEGETRVPVIVLTNTASQGRVEAAVEAIEGLDSITGEIARIRVEALDG
jgi:homoserine dehydrogenase